MVLDMNFFTTEQKQLVRYTLNIGVCILLIILPCVFIILLSYNPDSYYNLMPKEVRLASASSPRIIIVGGSGAGISVDSKILEKETAYHTANMGSSAGLGLRFMFRSIESELLPGDVVLYFMESTVIQQPLYAEGASLLATLHPSPLYAFTILSDIDMFTAHTIVDVTRKFPTWLQQQIRGLYVRKIESLVYEPEPTLNERLYNVYNFDARGDIDSSIAGGKHLTTAEVLKSWVGHMGDRGANTDALAFLQYTITSLEKRGVRVFVLWPAFAKTLYDTQIDRVRGRIEQVEDVIGREHIIGSFGDFVVSDESFLDETSHLTGAGRSEYTKRLIPLLKRRLEAK